MFEHRPSTYVLLLCTVFSTPCSLLSPAAAQEVQWRTDYNQARKEAAAKNRPLVLDFGAERCLWCKKLDATTFRDERVIHVMNEHFISLKVDADREAGLTQALHIQSLPTLVIAAPDGKILGMLEGYMEADRLHAQLQGALAGLGNSDWITRDYQQAAQAITASDYARAIPLLKSLSLDDRNPAVQLKAKQVLRDVEEQASGMLARASQLEGKGETSEAIAVLSEVVRTFPGTQAATESGPLLASLTAKSQILSHVRLRQARELLAQAREDYRTGQYLGCLDRCERLGTNFADLPEATEGLELAHAIKNNPEWLQQACETLSERLSGLYLVLAESCMRKNQPQQAAHYLERVMQAFPGTSQAETARLRLSTLQGQATWQAEFKKP
jgi:thioredoxin-related protein